MSDNNSQEALSKNVINYHIQDKVFIIRLANKPVNALSKAIRVGIINAMEIAQASKDVEAIVISSELALFSAGADISEFSSGDLEPMLPDVLTIIENSSKPVVAAVNGGAFGGGLELALACHYRVSVVKNKVGLPEVHLGILPGAGGTQRLPRLVGAQKALQMIVTGAPTAVEHISEMFVDIVTPDTLLASAIEVAKQAIGKPIPATSNIQISMNDELQSVFDQTMQQTKTKTRGFFAPTKCIEAVHAAFKMPFKEGLEEEARLFMQCLETPQARAQQHFSSLKEQQVQYLLLQKIPPPEILTKSALLVPVLWAVVSP